MHHTEWVGARGRLSIKNLFLDIRQIFIIAPNLTTFEVRSITFQISIVVFFRPFKHDSLDFFIGYVRRRYVQERLNSGDVHCLLYGNRHRCFCSGKRRRVPKLGAFSLRGICFPEERALANRRKSCRIRHRAVRG